jgi:hypothetical protein
MKYVLHCVPHRIPGSDINSTSLRGERSMKTMKIRKVTVLKVGGIGR